MRQTRSNRPSLIGTAARTAVIAGTATATAAVVGGSMQKSAQQKAMAQQAQAAAQQAQIDAAVQQAISGQVALASTTASEAAAPGGGMLTEEKIAQLKQAGELHQAGILSDEEFAAMKAKILQ